MDGQLRRCDPRAAFRQPWWWGALAVLVVNDHLLKGSGLVPGVLTGKLSDFAGLIVAPPLLASVLGVTRTRAFVGCAVLVGCVFASIKTFPPVTAAVEALSARLGVPWRVWCDPTDLVALPALLLGLRCGRVPARSRGARNAGSRWTMPGHCVAVFAGSLACLATSMPRPREPRSVQADDTRRVYAALSGGPIHVVDAPSGRLMRKIAIAPERGSDWTFDSRRIYGVGTEGLVAHDLSSGKPLFQTNIECKGCRTRVVPGGERVFVFVRHPGYDDAPGAVEWVFALDHDNGKVAWTRKLESPSPEDELNVYGVHPVFANETLLVPTADGLLEVSHETGAMRWISRAKAPSWLAAADRLLYFVSENDLLELPFAGGPELWRLPLVADSSRPWLRAKLGIGADRIVYSYDGRLTALDRTSKQPAWQADCSELLLVGAEIALALVDYRTLAAFDLTDGRKLWQVRERYGFEAPVLSEDLVVTRVNHSFARAYDARTGARRWELDLGTTP